MDTGIGALQTVVNSHQQLLSPFLVAAPVTRDSAVNITKSTESDITISAVPRHLRQLRAGTCFLTDKNKGIAANRVTTENRTIAVFLRPLFTCRFLHFNNRALHRRRSLLLTSRRARQ